MEKQTIEVRRKYQEDPSKEIEELKDTVPMMTSADYKERFKAEYHQLRIRYIKLSEIIKKWDAHNSTYYMLASMRPTLEQALGFKPSCSLGILKQQQSAMSEYLNILEVRATIEEIDL